MSKPDPPTSGQRPAGERPRLGQRAGSFQSPAGAACLQIRSQRDPSATYLQTPIPHPTCDGETRTRTGDTTIFSRVLYQLSYLATRAGRLAPRLIPSRYLTKVR